MPLRAAARESGGGLTPKDGGANRGRLPRRPAFLIWVGDLPAAAGAEAGVGMDLVDMSSLGVNEGRMSWPVFPEVTVLKLYRTGFERVCSSSKVRRFRLVDSRFGSTFSESEFSGEACLRFSEGAELVRPKPELITISRHLVASYTYHSDGSSRSVDCVVSCCQEGQKVVLQV